MMKMENKSKKAYSQKIFIILVIFFILFLISKLFNTKLEFLNHYQILFNYNKKIKVLIIKS